MDIPTITLVTQAPNFPCKQAVNDYLTFLNTCSRYGVKAIQLRSKTMNDTDFIEFGKKIKETLLNTQTLLIVNDRINACIEIDADGLHLGQNDGCITEARNILGPKKVIGLSVNTIDQAIKANKFPIDYIGVGPIFYTKNKPEQKPLDLESLKKITALSRHHCIAIGGITIENTRNILRAGAYGIAAIGAFHESKDIQKTITSFNHSIEESHHDS